MGFLRWSSPGLPSAEATYCCRAPDLRGSLRELLGRARLSRRLLADRVGDLRLVPGGLFARTHPPLMAQSRVDGSRPGGGDAAGDDPAGRRLFDPQSYRGRNGAIGRADDPAPGILRVTRHPVMWAIGLWAISHVIANGDLRSLVFFGAFAALSLGGTVLIDRKKRLALGSNWSRLAEVTSNLPFAALVTGRTRLRWRDISLLRIAAGLLLYVVLYRAHSIIAGVPVVIP